MGTRIELQKILEELLNSRNVYYQPPETLKMEYPCIRYSKSKRINQNANNTKYVGSNRYDIVVISQLPDHEVIDKILDLPYSSHDRHYKSDNLNHDIITLYY